MCTPGETAQIITYANRYQQIKKLGQGSFGTVYLVHDPKSKHEKKVLKAIYIGDESPNESLDAEHEASMLARLRHPNILRFYDSFVEAPYFCIVTEYCEDGDLDQLLKSLRRQRSRLQMDQVIEFFIQLLSATNFLHSKRILHRDIKTSNIFLKRNCIKLGDFGIARLLMNTLDQASTFIGTPFYMSPETLKYDGYNMKSDIWSLGCVLYELSVCKRAFERSNLVQAMDAILRESPPPLPERFPQRIRELYSQMLSKDPDKRLKTSELLEEFKQIQHHTKHIDNTTTNLSASGPIQKAPQPDFHRSYSNSPITNKHLQHSLQVPSSPVQSASSVDSVDSSENNVTDDIQEVDNNLDPFSATAKQKKIDFCRSKAQELLGSENFTNVYNYLQEERKKQSEDPTRTDDVIVSGLHELSVNSYACTLVDELVLHEILNELKENAETT